MSRSIPIFFETIQVGSIETEGGVPRFVYDQDWRSRPGCFPLSLSMPMEREDGHVAITPWLANLLPEGEAISAIGRNLGMSADDVIGLIERIGRDTAGAMSIGRPRNHADEAYHPIEGPDALERLIQDMPKRPLLAGADGISMSLAGVQDKLPVFMDGQSFFVPMKGAPSTHIMKPNNIDLAGSVQNEALCMVLAHRAGLGVANVTTGAAGDRSYLLVERYDRINRSGFWRRLHQEDFCQALARPPAAKYEHGRSASGVSLKEMFDLAHRHMTAISITRFIDAVIFNVLVANVDSHAKNYSILLGSNGPTIAPLYDLMCGDVWPSITQNLPQDIGGKNRGRHIAARHWRRMSEECSINGTAVLRRVSHLARLVHASVDLAADDVRAMPAGGHPSLGAICHAIKSRCSTILANLQNEDDRDDDREQDPIEIGV
jgi:serine/threonine-protein kinase HipA